MYGIAMSTPLQFGNAVAVRSARELEYLVKESEIQTGRPGREFVLQEQGATSRFRVDFDGSAFNIVSLSGHSPCVKLSLLARELDASEFGIAMRQYRVFCEPLPEVGPCCCLKTASTPAR